MVFSFPATARMNVTRADRVTYSVSRHGPRITPSAHMFQPSLSHFHYLAYPTSVTSPPPVTMSQPWLLANSAALWFTYILHKNVIVNSLHRLEIFIKKPSYTAREIVSKLPINVREDENPNRFRGWDWIVFKRTIFRTQSFKRSTASTAWPILENLESRDM